MNNTLEHWFGLNSNEEIKIEKEVINKHANTKTIFYFDSTTMKSYWLSKKPKNISFSFIVNWDKIPILLCTNLNQNDSYEIPKETYYNNEHLSFIKSNLQKCIRRQLSSKAIKTGYHMIKLNLNEFLRRISIIIIEDIILHESYSTIIWLMVATSSKKNVLKITKNIVDWLLGLIKTLCDINEYDILEPTDKKYHMDELNNYDLLYSLQFRKSYGGMNGDMKMLNYATNSWLNKFNNNVNCDTTKINLIDSNEINTLDLKELELDNCNIAGLDFHCFPFMIKMINKKHNNYTEKEIRSAIWNCSSKINYRKVNNNDDNNNNNVT